MTEVAVRPLVVEGEVIWSSLASEPPPESPLRGCGLVWTPASRAEIAASIAAARRRRWWWRVRGRR